MTRKPSAALAEYTGDFPDLAELRSTVEQIWTEAVKKDPQLRAQMGLTERDSQSSVPFRLNLTQGGDLASVSLTVMATSSAIHLGVCMLHDLWKGVVLPQLKRRFGTVFRQPATDKETVVEPPAPTKKVPMGKDVRGKGKGKGKAKAKTKSRSTIKRTPAPAKRSAKRKKTPSR
jgi:hypothetical protein